MLEDRQPFFDAEATSAPQPESPVLADKRSRFQHIHIRRHPLYGGQLLLDGDLQISESDTAYGVAMTSPLLALPPQARVAILGGGDGGVLRELLRTLEPLDRLPAELSMVEIDPRVIELSRRHLPAVCGDALSHPAARGTRERGAGVDRTRARARRVGAPCPFVQLSRRAGDVSLRMPGDAAATPPGARIGDGRDNMRLTIIRTCLIVSLLPAMAPAAWSACRDAVVLVHGNAGSPSDFDNTRSELLSRGHAAGDVFRPDWGSKSCAACNDHDGGEEAPVLDAMLDAIAASCSGRIDVIGHSMGATLAARQIADNGLGGYVDAFVGVAGAFRGLWSCGTYPFHVPTTTCGAWGLSVSSPFLDGLYGERFGTRVYSIKSYADQVVCYGGVCTVGGIHSSSIWNENASYTYSYGHFGLLSYTAARQASLIE